VNAKKLIAAVFICILLLNIVLFALNKIDEKTFWVVILAGFIASYTIKRINKNKEKKK
jgi:fructose-specific phosphotransferase system IIC component